MVFVDIQFFCHGGGDIGAVAGGMTVFSTPASCSAAIACAASSLRMSAMTICPT